MPTHSSPSPSFEHIRKHAKKLLRLHRGGANNACVVLRQLARFAGKKDSAIIGAAISLQEMQLALAKAHGAASWAELRKRLGAPTAKSESFGRHLPVPRIPSGKKPGEFLLELCLEGAKRRIGRPNTQVLRRIHKEVDEICKRGFENGFLAAWELAEFLRKNRIPRGPGRGNQPTSIVLFCLGFTDIEPVSHGLRFERLLGEPGARPYFDVDISHRQLPMVGSFLRKRYGASNVVTVKLSRKQAFITSTLFAVADCPIPELGVSGKKERNGEITVSTKGLNPLTELGCFILHVSGLRLLDIVADCEAAVGKSVEMGCKNPTEPINREVRELLQSGDVEGIWDANLHEFPKCPPITPEACRALAPKTCEELALVIAYAGVGYRKEDRDKVLPRMFPEKVGRKVRPWPEAVAGILAPTGGVPVFQDQIMEIGENIGGLQGRATERFLKSFRSESPYGLRVQEEFRQGAVKRIGEKETEALVGLLKKHRWWFNKGHAVAYANLVLSAARLKAAYPREYTEAVKKNS